MKIDVRQSLFFSALGLAFLVPLLNYLRLPPISTFHTEALSALVFGCLLLLSGLVLVRRTDVSPADMVFPGFMAALIALQVLLGIYEYPLVWLIWLAGLSVFVVAMSLARAVSLIPELRSSVVDRLAWTWLLIAITNTAFQWLQALGWAEALYPFVFLQGDGAELAKQVCRPTGNIAQANHTNTVMWLAIVAALYLWRKAAIRPWVFAIVVAVLLSGSALAGSRMAWFFLVAVIASLAACARPLGLDLKKVALLGGGLTTGFLVWNLAIPLIYPAGYCDSGFERIASGSGNWVRVELLRQAIMVWLSSPWIGVGGGHFMAASFGLETHLTQQQPLDFYPHNLLLHVLAEFGVIGLVILLAAALTWGWQAWRRRNLDAERWPAIAWISILLIHSMLEFPLWYFYFLVMFALALGIALGGVGESERSIRLPRWVFAMSGIALLGVTGYVVADYRQMESVTHIAKLGEQIGPARPPAADEMIAKEAEAVQLHGVYVDHAVHALMAIDGTNMEDKAARNAKLLKNLPAPDVLSRQILIDSREGRDAAARDLVRRMLVFWPSFATTQLDFLEKLGRERPKEFPGLADLVAEERKILPQRRDGLAQGSAGAAR